MSTLNPVPFAAIWATLLIAASACGNKDSGPSQRERELQLELELAKANSAGNTAASGAAPSAGTEEPEPEPEPEPRQGTRTKPAENARSNDQATTAAREAQAEAARARDEARGAQALAAAERMTRLRNEAPRRVSVSPMGCTCTADHTITVTCGVSNGAEVPVQVTINATADTGSFGIGSRGYGGVVALDPGQKVAHQVVTAFRGAMDCSSCANARCSGSVVVQ